MPQKNNRLKLLARLAVINPFGGEYAPVPSRSTTARSKLSIIENIIDTR